MQMQVVHYTCSLLQPYGGTKEHYSLLTCGACKQSFRKSCRGGVIQQLLTRSVLHQPSLSCAATSWPSS